MSRDLNLLIVRCASCFPIVPPIAAAVICPPTINRLLGLKDLNKVAPPCDNFPDLAPLEKLTPCRRSTSTLPIPPLGPYVLANMEGIGATTMIEPLVSPLGPAQYCQWLIVYHRESAVGLESPCVDDAMTLITGECTHTRSRPCRGRSRTDHAWVMS